MPGFLDIPGLDPQTSQFVRNQGLLGLGAGLLSASGPSTKPVSFGQALGQGLLGFNQFQQGALSNLAALRKQNLGKYENVKVDDKGQAFGLNKETGRFERIPTEEGFTEFKTVQGVGPSGLPEIRLVAPALMGQAGGEIKLEGKAPEGFRPVRKPDGTTTLEPIPGGPKDPLSAEAAGRAQMLRTAKQQIPLVRELTFDKEGKPIRTNIVSAQVGGIPGTTGRKLSTAMEVGIQAITRIETGAAMPPSEVKNTRKRFEPSVFDDDETVKLKIDMFEDFISGNLKLLDPSGRFDEARFQSELAKRKQGKQAQQPGIKFLGFE